MFPVWAGYLRDVLGIKNSEHLEVKISEHNSRNLLAQKTALGESIGTPDEEYSKAEWPDKWGNYVGELI